MKAGRPQSGSMVIRNRFVCDRRMAGFDLILHCLRYLTWHFVRLVASSWIELMMLVLVLYLREVDIFNVIQWCHWCWM